MAGQNTFSSIVEARAVGAPEINALTEALNKQSESLDKIATRAKAVNDHPGFSDFAAKVKSGIQDPLGTAGEMVEGFLNKLGPMGAALSAGAAGFAMMAKSGLDGMKALGSFGTEIEHTAIRMGLTTKEVAQFRFAAQYAGGDVGTFEMAMRKLSQEVEGGGKNLRAMGVQFRDLHTGALLPTKDVLVDLATKLAAMPDAFERNAEAIKVLGRAGLEVLPELLELPEGLKRAEELQEEYTPAQLARWKEYQHQIAEIESAWESLKLSMKEPLAAVVSFALNYFPDQAGKPWGSPGEAVAAATHGAVGRPSGAGSPITSAMLSFPGSVQSVRTGDSLIDAVLGTTDEERLEKAKQKLKELRTELEGMRGLYPEASAAKRQEVIDEEAVVKGIEAHIKAEKQLADWKAKWGAEETKAYFKRAEYIGTGSTANSSDYRFSSGLWGAAPLTANGGWAEGLLKTLAEKEPSADYLDYMRKELAQPGRDIDDYFRSLRGPAGVSYPGYTSPDQALRNATHGGTRALGLLGAQSSLSGASQEAEIERAYQLRMGMAANELEALGRLAELKATQEEKDRAHQDAFAQTSEKYFEAQMEREQQLLQLAVQQKEAFVSGAVGLFDSVRSGRTMDWFKGIERSLENRVVGAAAGDAWGALNKSGAIPHASDGSFLGQVLKGTPFGPDPMKAAGMTLNTAGDKLIGAAAALAAVARGGAGPYAPAAFSGAIPGGPSSGSLAGGWTTDADGLPVYSSGAALYGADSSASPATWGADLGIGAGILGGGLGMYAGLSSGGARGAMTAAGSAAAMAGAVLPLISKSLNAAGPIGMAVGMGLGMLATFLPDAKTERAKQLTDERNNNAYSDPSALSYTSDAAGDAISHDFRGGVRTTVVNNYLQTMDSASFEQYLVRNPNALAVGITAAVMGGNGADISGALQLNGMGS